MFRKVSLSNQDVFKKRRIKTSNYISIFFEEMHEDGIVSSNITNRINIIFGTSKLEYRVSNFNYVDKSKHKING